jgi:DNA-3-methyladenine glycosylase
MKLPVDFYLQPDVVQVAKNLLGKLLITKIGKQTTSGIIVETEAYAGKIDKASHAYGGKFTSRTQTMYQPGGVSYVYLCYGIHHLFNVVTNVEGTPDAVLIRAIEPLDGIETMLKRSGLNPFN